MEMWLILVALVRYRQVHLDISDELLLLKIDRMLNLLMPFNSRPYLLCSTIFNTLKLHKSKNSIIDPPPLEMWLILVALVRYRHVHLDISDELQHCIY